MTDSDRSQSKSAIADGALFLAGAVAVLYPVALAHVRYGAAAPFKFFASDAFYYLNVARRSQGLAFFTYDGSHATNGFHPLWQWLLTGLFRVTGLTEASDQQLRLALVVCAALAAVGVGLLAVCASRLIGSRPLALVLTIPGLFELLFSKVMSSTIDATEAAPWYAVNGMESGLSLFWFGIFALLLLQRPALGDWSLARLVAASGVLSVMMLSRLDDVFLLVAFAGAALLLTRERRHPIRVLLAIGTLPSLTLGTYLVYNFTTTRLLFPVSASMKRDVGALATNLRDGLQALIPTKLVSEPALFMWDVFNYRALQLWLPMLIAAVFLALCLLTQAEQRGSARGQQRSLLAMLAVYVLLKGSYNAVNVHVLSQGHWYFTVSIASANLMLAYLIGNLRWPAPQLVEGWRGRLRWAFRGAGALALLLGALLALLAHTPSRLLFALVMLAVPGVLIAVYAERLVSLLGSVSGTARRKLLGLAGAVAAGAFLLMYGNAVVSQKVDSTYGETHFEFWKARQRIGAELARAAPAAKLFELDDGIMAYALELPTMSGTGLAIDAAAYAQCRAQRCLDVAYERGFRVISSVQYWGYANEQRFDFRRPRGEPQIIEALVGQESFEVPQGAERYDFSLLLSSELGKHVIHFLTFEPKPDPGMR